MSTKSSAICSGVKPSCPWVSSKRYNACSACSFKLGGFGRRAARSCSTSQGVAFGIHSQHASNSWSAPQRAAWVAMYRLSAIGASTASTFHLRINSGGGVIGCSLFKVNRCKEMNGFVINNSELYTRCIDQLIYLSLSSTTFLIHILFDLLSL